MRESLTHVVTPIAQMLYPGQNQVDLDTNYTPIPLDTNDQPCWMATLIFTSTMNLRISLPEKLSVAVQQ